MVAASRSPQTLVLVADPRELGTPSLRHARGSMDPAPPQ